MDAIELGIRGLLSQDPAILLARTPPTDHALQNYARQWLTLVAKELRSEIAEALSRRAPRGTPEWFLSVQAVRDSEACALDVQRDDTESGAGDEDDDDEARPPPLLHTLLLSCDHDILFFVSGVGDSCRALAFDAGSLRSDTGSAVLTKLSLNLSRHKCLELLSAQSAIQRAHALCSLHLLHPSLASLLTAKDSGRGGRDDYRGPWRALSPTDTEQQRQVDRLNEGQRRALAGVRGAATLVQGPPGTGKSSFITAAVLARVPPGARILACTATNKAIDSLVSKLEEAGFSEMLAVGSTRSMGERASEYLMSRRLEREAGVARAEVWQCTAKPIAGFMLDCWVF